MTACLFPLSSLSPLHLLFLFAPKFHTSASPNHLQRRTSQLACAYGLPGTEDSAYDELPRIKRYAIEGSFWGVRNISYRIARKSQRMEGRQTEEVLKRAFAVWEEKTNLSFSHTPNAEAHINIVFVENSHGDGEPFDGIGGVLAHAFFPRYGGGIHFDDAEPWSDSKHNGRDLYAVAVHEIGHALGLKHSRVHEAVMAPFYQQYTGSAIHLHKDDMMGIGRLYGPEGAATLRGASRVREQQNKVSAPDICKDPSLDAITRLGNGSLYAFKGDYFWRLLEEGGVERGFPRRIADIWPFPSHIDAILTDSEGDSYVFKGSEYWLLGRKGQLLPAYPSKISNGLVDTPDDIDAALVWHRDHLPYLFKKDRYWRYSRYGLGVEWPQKIQTIFRHIDAPERIDAAIQFSPNESFLFAGTKYYKIVGFRSIRVSPGYPRSIGDFWFGCDKRHHPIK